MRDFPDFVEIYPVCQHSAVLPDISLILLSIGSYLELAIFREDFSSVASVKCSIFVSVGGVMGGGGGGGQAPACFHYGLSRLSEVTIFVTDACMLNPVREGEED